MFNSLNGTVTSSNHGQRGGIMWVDDDYAWSGRNHFCSGQVGSVRLRVRVVCGCIRILHARDGVRDVVWVRVKWHEWLPDRRQGVGRRQVCPRGQAQRRHRQPSWAEHGVSISLTHWINNMASLQKCHIINSWVSEVGWVRWSECMLCWVRWVCEVMLSDYAVQATQQTLPTGREFFLRDNEHMNR